MKVAVVQLKANENKRKNISQALRFVRRAIKAKAVLICLPEVFNYRGPATGRKFFSDIAEEIPGETTLPFIALAKKHKVFILAGSVYERVKGKKKAYNTSVLINATGKVCAKYRKIHLFDAELGNKSIRETRLFLPGKKLAASRVKNFKVGMSICFDVRFPEMFRQYARRGCHLFVVPSCFTKKTGAAHWETLLRARAIENLCYVLAPNQAGKDAKDITAYGNSMIIGPWGETLARASGNRTEIIYANLDGERIRQARKALPTIFRNRRHRTQDPRPRA